MAQKATIYKVELSVSDMDRHYYETHKLTIAKHPSETDERMMLRILAFALNADEQLEMTKGLSTDDEPDIWEKSLSGELNRWISLGLPSDKIVRQSCGKAKSVIIYAYGGNPADMWWSKIKNSTTRFDNLTVVSLAQTETKELAGALKKKAQKATEEYAAFWENFGAVLKEGLIEDPNLRDRILEVCRFSSTHGGDLTSLADYVERSKEGQEEIYYITGEDAKKVAQSPHLEGFKAKGVEVLLLSDHVDEFWLQHITEFEGKTFKSVTRGAADLDKITGDEKADDANDDAKAPALDELLAAIKLELGAAIKDVRPSKRLTDSPVCLIADDGDLDVNMERLLKQHGQLQDGMPRVLELNPDHRIVKKLAERAKADDASSDGLLKDAAHLLLDQARISEGEIPADPADFVRRLSAIMDNAL